MAIIVVHPDVVVEGEGIAFDTPQMRGISMRRTASPPVAHDPFFEVASAADAQLLTDLRILPSTRRSEPPPGVAKIDVTVSPDEAAILLVEDENGLLSWRYPDATSAADGGARRRGAGLAPATLRFTLAGVPTASGARRRSWLGDKIIEKLAEPVRIAVLRFLVSHTLDAAMRRIEGDMTTGLVNMSGSDAANWIPGTVLQPIAGADPLRVLLMVHGTFSSTAGSFGSLAGTPEWEAAVTGRYGLILGQDHRTLAETPEDNANQIADSLYRLALPAGTIIDAVAFSRGGLVLRSFAEQIAPRRLPHLVFGKAIFVGCTNAGTLLAEPENWETLVNIYTNLIAGVTKLGLTVAGAGTAAPWVSYAIKTLGRFVQMLSQIAISERQLPGLAAMEPNGDVVERLNASPAIAPGDPLYFVVASDFASQGKAGEILRSAVLFAADRFADELMKQGNDLVVNTASMGNFGAARTTCERRMLAGDEHVFHTAYFASPTTRKALADWLGSADQPAAGQGRRTGTRRGAPVPAVPAPAPAAGAIVERYIAAEIEPFPRVEQKANLYVTVSPNLIEIGDHAGAAATSEAVRLDRSQPLTILVMATRNCTIEGAAQAQIELTSEEDAIRKFSVRGIASGEAQVLVEARQGMVDGAGGRAVASFLLKPIFISKDERAERIVQTLSLPAATGRQAVLRIYEFIDNNHDIVLRFDLGSEDPAIAVLEDVRLPSKFPLAEFSAGILASLDDAYNLNADAYESFLADFIDKARVRTAELIPERVRKALWENREAISEVQVVSQEALVPWELMCLFEPGSANPGEKPQFLADWGLTRWLHNVPLCRSQST
jgi:hypothetical protein